MKIYEISDRNACLISALLRIWKESVRATHLFLSDSEIEKIKEHVPQALGEVEHLVAVEDDCGRIVGFMGTAANRLEMLFLSPDKRGHGTGKQLINFGITNYGINEVTVNEQNPQAVGFYKHIGFETYKRTDFDEQGNPYPLLYMKLSAE